MWSRRLYQQGPFTGQHNRPCRLPFHGTFFFLGHTLPPSIVPPVFQPFYRHIRSSLPLSDHVLYGALAQDEGSRRQEDLFRQFGAAGKWHYVVHAESSTSWACGPLHERTASCRTAGWHRKKSEANDRPKKSRVGREMEGGNAFWKKRLCGQQYRKESPSLAKGVNSSPALVAASVVLLWSSLSCVILQVLSRVKAHRKFFQSPNIEHCSHATVFP